MTILKLDHDTRRCPARWYWRAAWLARRMGWRLLAFSYARSTSGGWHGEVIIAGTVEPVTVIAAQAILGSHWALEGYNLMRVHSAPFRSSPLWRARANILYERHERRKRV